MIVLATFTSDSSGATYEVREGEDGRVYCTCKSWAFSKKDPKTCKHLERIRSFTSSPAARSEFRKMLIKTVAGSAEADVLR